MEEKENNQEYHYLSVDYVKYKTQLTKKFINRKSYVEKDPRQVAAFIPGTIKKVYVSEDKKVKSGDKLLILEAMKMKNVITCPMDGIIKAVHVKQGEIVAKNAILIELH